MEEKTMMMQGLVLSAEVSELALYDQMTGQLKPGYSVRMRVLDGDSDEKYECQVSEGLPGLDDLKLLKKQGQPTEALQQAAMALQAQLPAKMTPVTLQVKRIKAKGGFVTLVCSLVAA
jgi:hypothetical protein